MTIIIDGKAVAAQIRQEAKVEATTLLEQGITPCLAVVLLVITRRLKRM